jgi:hypothetical protein
MAIAMYVNDDPNASAGNAAFVTVLGLAFASLALSLYRPLCRKARTTSSAVAARDFVRIAGLTGDPAAQPADATPSRSMRHPAV